MEFRSLHEKGIVINIFALVQSTGKMFYSCKLVGNTHSTTTNPENSAWVHNTISHQISTISAAIVYT